MVEGKKQESKIEEGDGVWELKRLARTHRPSFLTSSVQVPKKRTSLALRSLTTE